MNGIKNLDDSQREYLRLAIRGCGRKRVRAHSKEEALAFARRTKKRRGMDLIPYKCDYCDRWHLTKRGTR